MSQCMSNDTSNGGRLRRDWTWLDLRVYRNLLVFLLLIQNMNGQYIHAARIHHADWMAKIFSCGVRIMALLRQTGWWADPDFDNRILP